MIEFSRAVSHTEFVDDPGAAQMVAGALNDALAGAVKNSLDRRERV